MDLTSVITSGIPAADRGQWLDVMVRAACSSSGLGPDEWYPISAPPAAARLEAAAAIAVCATCPVRAACLELSLRHWGVGQHGIWGGTVPAERVELRRERTRHRAGGVTASAEAS